jgi:hypothetical protein
MSIPATRDGLRPRRKTGRGRGRPRQAGAKRHATTRIGRKTGHDPVDQGTPQLRA